MSRDSPVIRYRFGPFELDPEERILRREEEEIALQDLPFRLLTELLEQAPSLVSRESLRSALWPPDTHLDVDASLNTAVARVREALGDEPGNPRYVATVPRRGYKLVATVERIAARQLNDRRWPWAAGLAVSLVLLALGLGLRSEAPPASSDRTEATAADQIIREHLLIARHHADRRSRHGLEKAIASYQSAAALDPESADAYSGLAVSYALLGIYDYWRPREAFGPAETMARRALELDPSSGEAHLAAALVAAVGSWDWHEAGLEIERAVALAPESAEVWLWQGGFLNAIGRHDEAIASTEKALSLAPTSSVIHTALAWRLFQAGRGDDAIRQSHRTIDLVPDYYDAWDNLKWIHLTLGHEAEAVDAWTRAEVLRTGDGDDLAQTYREHGLEGLHRSSIHHQTERWEKGRYQSPYDIVLEYTAIGDVEQAISWLERSFAERETDLVDLAVDPRLDLLRGEDRFQEILAEIGMPRSPGAASPHDEDRPAR